MQSDLISQKREKNEFYFSLFSRYVCKKMFFSLSHWMRFRVIDRLHIFFFSKQTNNMLLFIQLILICVWMAYVYFLFWLFSLFKFMCVMLLWMRSIKKMVFFTTLNLIFHCLFYDRIVCDFQNSVSDDLKKILFETMEVGQKLVAVTP